MPVHQPATINVAFLHPVLDALGALGCTEATLARQLGLRMQDLSDPTQLLPANQVYGFLEWATGISGDPSFCADLGQRMAAGAWAPIAPMLTGDRSVGDFIVHFSQVAEAQGPAAQYTLEVTGGVALLRLVRPADASEASRFADAIAAGFFVEVLKRASASDWTARDVLAVVSDPDLVPDSFLPGASKLAGGQGFTLRFPSGWLRRKMPEIGQVSPGSVPEGPSRTSPNFIERIRQLVEVRLDEPGFGPQDIADSLGISRWKLQETLRAQGTHVSALRDDIRKTIALDRLATSDDAVAHIARTLGYSDASNFTRAFRGWTGLSPRAFRAKTRGRAPGGQR